MKGVSTLALLLVLGVVAIGMGLIDPAKFLGKAQLGSAGQVTETAPVTRTADPFCGGLNTVSVFASERDEVNTSQSFMSGLFVAVPAGINSITATATGTEGGTETLTTLAVPCSLTNSAGKIYSTTDTVDNGNYLGTYDFSGKR